jgi:hypothetical protein
VCSRWSYCAACCLLPSQIRYTQCCGSCGYSGSGEVGSCDWTVLSASAICACACAWGKEATAPAGALFAGSRWEFLGTDHVHLQGMGRTMCTCRAWDGPCASAGPGTSCAARSDSRRTGSHAVAEGCLFWGLCRFSGGDLTVVDLAGWPHQLRVSAKSGRQYPHRSIDCNACSRCTQAIDAWAVTAGLPRQGIPRSCLGCQSLPQLVQHLANARHCRQAPCT